MQGDGTVTVVHLRQLTRESDQAQQQLRAAQSGLSPSGDRGKSTPMKNHVQGVQANEDWAKRNMLHSHEGRSGRQACVRRLGNQRRGCDHAASVERLGRVLNR